MISLYLHIPFCQSKCAYCDFPSFAGREGDMARYLCALEAEMAAAREAYGALELGTLFVGGGTPTLLSPGQIAALFRAVRRNFHLLPGAEITVEGNPGTLSPDKLDALLEAGVNRVSLGAQAAQPRLLGALGRIHTWDQVVASVALLRRAGFQNLNLDLMYALPGQSARDWAETLDAACQLPISHLSAYSLIVEEGTPLYEGVRAGRLQLPDEELALAMQSATEQKLAMAGYARYEISNYARPGFECRHNLAYWRRGEYLGLGLAAHSLMRGRRFSNTPKLSAYLSGAREHTSERLTAFDEIEEHILLETRTTAGLDLNRLRQINQYDLLARRATAVDALERLGLIRVSEGRLALTSDGMRVQNAVVIQLMEDR